MRIYIGSVFSGKRIARRRVNENSELYYKKTGIHFFNGTLNVKIKNGPIIYEKHIFINQNEICTDGSKTDILLIPAKMKDQNVYILYPMNPYYDRTVIELMTECNLREKYSIKDNDLIEIMIE